MQKHLEIIEVNPAKTGTSKNGKAYSITECECIVLNPDGTKQVGVLTLGRNIDASKIQPGLYGATFDLSVSFQDRKIGAVVTDLKPVNRGELKTELKQGNPLKS